MAKLTPGLSLAQNEYLTIAKLYALIDTTIAAADGLPGLPTLYDVVMADLDTVRAIHVATSPSSPATNDLMVGTDGYLDRWNGSAWVDVGNDPLYLINSSAFTLVTGTPLVADETSATKCKLWDGVGACYRPLGVSAGVCAQNATATVITDGFALIRVPFPTAKDSHVRIAAHGATALSTAALSDSSILAIVVQTDNANPLSGVALAKLVH